VNVALFVPCYVDQLAPDVAWAALQVLERAGCRVSYDPEQTCCGQPFLNLGERAAAQRLARRHLERFSGVDAIVVPSGSCAATVRLRYAEIGVSDADGQSHLLARRTFELCEFLVNELGVTDLGARFPHRVALLASCHGLRDLALGTPSESVVEASPGPVERLLSSVRELELVRPERPDECCGFGGAFSVQHPELSVRIGRDRLRALAETGAEFVTSTDSSCLVHLDGIRRREGFGPRPLHLAEILAGGEAA
jgi:L-lactate dehydrogenase complex protein LldE